MGKFQDALSDMNKAISLSPKEVAHIYFTKAGIEKYVSPAHLEGLLSPSKNGANLNAEKQFELCCPFLIIDRSLGKLQNAVASYTSAIESSEGRHTESYLHRGLCYLELSRPELALADVNKVITFYRHQSQSKNGSPPTLLSLLMTPGP